VSRIAKITCVFILFICGAHALLLSGAVPEQDSKCIVAMNTGDGGSDIEKMRKLLRNRIVKSNDNFLSKLPDDVIGKVIEFVGWKWRPIKSMPFSIIPRHVVCDNGKMLLIEESHTTLQMHNNDTLSRDFGLVRKLSGPSGWAHALIGLPGGRFAAGSATGAIRIMNFHGIIMMLNAHEAAVNFLAVSSDNVLISGSDDTTIKVWNFDSGVNLKSFRGHTKGVLCCTLLSCMQLASGSQDHTVKIWRRDSGECVQTLQGHVNCVTSLAVLPDNQLISGSADTTVRIWDYSSGYCCVILRGHVGGIYDIIVSSRSMFVSKSLDQTLRIWDKNSLDYGDYDCPEVRRKEPLRKKETLWKIYTTFIPCVQVGGLCLGTWLLAKKVWGQK
jgi:WD40 repeat protein